MARKGCRKLGIWELWHRRRNCFLTGSYATRYLAALRRAIEFAVPDQDAVLDATDPDEPVKLLEADAAEGLRLSAVNRARVWPAQFLFFP